jgi:carbonic anhydrase
LREHYVRIQKLALKRVANIVVCGHSECGAMKAVIADEVRPETPNLAKWLRHAHGAAFRLKQEGALDANLTPHDQLSQLNVLVQPEHLMSYPTVRQKVLAGTLC